MALINISPWKVLGIATNVREPRHLYVPLSVAVQADFTTMAAGSVTALVL